MPFIKSEDEKTKPNEKAINNSANILFIVLGIIALGVTVFLLVFYLENIKINEAEQV